MHHLRIEARSLRVSGCALAAAYVAGRLERLLTLGYVSVVPCVLTLDQQDALHAHSSTAVMGNGMYAAHDEQVD